MKILKLLLLIVLVVGVHFGASLLFFTVKHDRSTHAMQWSFPFATVVEIPLWERKVSLEGEVLKVGLITDTHLDSKRIVPKGDPYKVKIPDQYQAQLDQFVVSMKDFQPAFIAHLGDIIEGTNVEQEVGILEIGLIRDAVARAGIQTYWALGNHDVRSVTRRDFQKELTQDGTNKVIDQGPYRFILLDANYRDDGTPVNPLSGDFVPGRVPKETMFWLEEQLKTDKHVYVFAHHSFVPFAMTTKGSVVNHIEVRALFSRYNVRAAFNGHIEKRFHAVIDGVNYYHFPGTKKAPEYHGAHYKMTLNEGEADISMSYQDQDDAWIEEPFLKAGHMVQDVIARDKALAEGQSIEGGDDGESAGDDSDEEDGS